MATKRKESVAMSRPSSVLETLREFIDEVGAILDLVEDVGSALTQANTPIGVSKSKLRMEQIHEFAFLRLILGWEEFLERTLVLYMMGKKSARGYQLDVKVKNIKDEKIAYILLSGKRNFNIDKDYLPYLADPRELKRIATALFESHCYDFRIQKSAKKGENPDLFECARHIRNRIVHRSTSSKVNFKNVVSEFVDKDHDYSPGELLLERPENNMKFGDQLIKGGHTYFGYYCLFFANLAARVAYFEKNKE